MIERFSTGLLVATLACFAANLEASPPVASYIFPAGGQRGTDVKFKVGGLFLHHECHLQMLGPGIQANPKLKSVPTLWFEGSVLPLPDSQRQEDYPKDMVGNVAIAKDAPLGSRRLRLWTSQGATPSLKFMVGELPEIVEEEIEGDPLPVLTSPPVTINGRIFPHEDVDLWSIQAKKGETFSCEIHAARLGSPLDAHLDALDPQGKFLAENEASRDGDPSLRFTAKEDGVYQVRVRDAQFQGGQAYVYRLTITNRPVIDMFFPLGGKRGEKIKLQLTGHAVPESVEVAIPADAKSDWHWPDMPDIKLDLDDLPERANGDDALASAPVIFNGRIDKPGAIERWNLSVTKGQPLQLELRASQLGSKLDGVVTIFDSAGKQLARSEGEKEILYTPTIDGVITVQVQDRFRTRGGLAFGYRLRVISAATPDFRLTFPNDAVSVLRKGQSKWKLNIERVAGFKEPIEIRAEGLPEGVTTKPLKITNQATTELIFEAEASAPIQVRTIKILGTAKDRKVVATWGKSPHDDVLCAVTIPTPFVIKGEYDMGFAARGGMHQRKYKIERTGFEGPIEISLADKQARHLQGVKADKITIPPGQNEFTYSVYLPPYMETGRTCRVCVMGVGVVRDGDQEHRVAFSSVNQNEQLVAVVGPGQLAIDLEKSSGFVEPGKSLSIPVRIKRGLNLKGEVRLELIVPPHLRGILADPATIAADQERGTLTIRFEPRLDGAFNMPFIVRATLTQDQRPYVAEASLDLQP